MHSRLLTISLLATAMFGCGDSMVEVASPVLERSVSVAPGAACTAGGTEIRTGRDRNANGVLDDGEVERSDTVCDAAIVTRVIDEPAGARCPAGGHVVRSGPDRNGNGVLDDDEGERSEVVCSGVAPATLIRVDLEPAGAHCASGGHAVRSGPDRNGNGALDDDEIATTTFACEVAALLEGDFTQAMWQDPAAVAALQEVRVITGNLTIDSAAPVALPHLVQVGGSVTLIRAGTPTQLEVPALAEVGADLVAGGSGFTGELRLPALTRVGGSLAVERVDPPGPAATHAASAPALVEVGRTLRITLSAADEVSLPALQTVRSQLQLENLALPVLALPALVSAGAIEMLDVGQAVELPVLRSADELLVAAGNTRTLRAPALAAAGVVTLDLLPELEQLSLPALRQVGLDVAITRCAKLAALDLPVLVSIGEAATIFRPSPVLALEGLPALETVALPRLRFLADEVSVATTGLHTISLPALENVTAIDLRDSPVSALSLGAVTTLARVELHDTQLVDLTSLRALASLDNLVLDGNPVLASLAGLEHLTAMAGELTLTGNATLGSLTALDQLMVVAGAVTVTDNPQLSPDEVAALIARVHHG